MMDSLKKYLKGIQLSKYIIIILLLCVTIFAGFFGVLLRINNANAERDNLSYNRSISETYSYKFNTAFSQLISSAQTLCSNRGLVDYVDSMENDAQKPSADVLHTVNQFLISNLNVYDIIISKNGQLKTFYMNTSDKKSLPILDDEDDIVKTTFVNNNSVLLIPLDIVKSMRKIGVCYLVVYTDMINGIFSNSMRVANTECYVLSDSMQILASPEDINGEKVSAMISLLFEKSGINEFTHKIGSKEYFVNRESLLLNGIYFYSFTPCRASVGELFSQMQGLIIIFAVAVLLLILCVYFFFRTFYNSIYALQGFIADKKAGLSAEAPKLFSQELSLLADEIDDMINSVEKLKMENYEIKIAQNESRFKALQSQLNPHFLFNTFNCIIGIARVYKVEKIEKICVSIAQIMRYSLSENFLTGLQEEIEIVSNYLSIQQIRFPNRFKVKMNIAKELLDKKIVRFSLQPLVENSIKYGLEPMEDGGILELNGYVKDNRMIIEVIDNGKGIEPEIFLELKSRLLGETNEKLNSHGCGIGILNIHNRLKLCYGNEYGLDIENVQTGGTKVTVCMPLEMSEDFTKFRDK